MIGWATFGYRKAHAVPPKDWGKQYAGSAICFRLTFWQRVLAMISGKIMVDIAHKFDRAPRAWKSVSDMAVLPPNFPFQQEE